MGSAHLTELFRGAAPAGVSARITDDEAHIERVLARLLDEARAARPSIDVPREDFVLHLALHFPPAATSIDALEELRASDLYLACACLRGDGAAMTVFDASYLANLGAVVPFPAGTNAGDVKQAVREKLLMGHDGDPPKIGDYSGRGDLGGWVRVVAMRVALNLARGKTREVELEESDRLADGAAGSDDAELGLLKKLYQAEFREAFQQALTGLPVRDRNMLRQHYIDGLTLEQIGAVYQVHRVTMVRRMTETRKELATETRRRLKAKLRVSRGELDSIMRLLQSQLDVSIRAYLEDH